jgi:hypothetical protein
MAEDPRLHARGPLPGATLDLHFELFSTDGVSMQSQELARALRSRKWHVHLGASDAPPGSGNLRLPELSYQSDDAIALRKRIFPTTTEYVAEVTESDGRALVDEIIERARPIRRQVEQYVRKHDIRLLHVRNIMSLPYNLPATLALHDLASDRPDLAFLMQHHDLYWEGPNAANFRTPHAEVADLIEHIICPDLPNARHVVISPIAQESLEDRRGLRSVVIPDGFDFHRQPVLIDEEVFRERLQLLVGNTRPLRADDLVVAMPARIAINKAIELPIQFVAGLERRRARLEAAPDGLGHKRRAFGKDSQVVLMLPQGKGLEENRGYFERLLAYARHSGITLAYGGDMVVADSQFVPGDRERYPFYSTYQAADFICFSAEHEGFGNQVIESIWAKRPVALLQYAVFKRYLRDHIPHFVSLGDTERLERLPGFGGLHQLPEDVLDQALDGTIALLTDHVLAARFTEENSQVMREFCGIDTVVEQYIALYKEAGMGVAPAPRIGEAPEALRSQPCLAPPE